MAKIVKKKHTGITLGEFIDKLEIDEQVLISMCGYSKRGCYHRGIVWDLITKKVYKDLKDCYVYSVTKTNGIKDYAINQFDKK